MLIALVLLTASAVRAQAPGPSQTAVAAAVAKIEAMDHGPRGLNAVLALDPSAMAQARAQDALHALGPLTGQPVLLKDNIDAAGMATTAGSLALANNVAAADAPVTARLRGAGMVILGKANLSEWANFRDGDSISGWSAVGGMTRNPHVLDRSPCGSSAGSAAAVAAGYVRFAVGTETNGSIVCPAAMNGVVGFKPTVGLVSRSGIVPISVTQDTAGPIAGTVQEAAALLGAMAGGDSADPATAEADARKMDYLAALSPDALKGRRLGIPVYLTGYSAMTDAAFARAVTVLKAQGAQVVMIEDFRPDPRLNDAETVLLQVQFKMGLEAYLARTPPAVTARTLEALIAFNANTPRETALFGQDVFEAAARDVPYLTYMAAVNDIFRLARREGIDRLLEAHRLDALIAPTTSPAWRVDSVVGDNFQRSASGLAAMAGYPHLTVPMGLAGGLPVGLSFIGPAWSDGLLLSLGYAYQQAAGGRTVPAFRKSLDEDIAAFAPSP